MTQLVVRFHKTLPQNQRTVKVVLISSTFRQNQNKIFVKHIQSLDKKKIIRIIAKNKMHQFCIFNKLTNVYLYEIFGIHLTQNTLLSYGGRGIWESFVNSDSPVSVQTT